MSILVHITNVEPLPIKTNSEVESDESYESESDEAYVTPEITTDEKWFNEVTQCDWCHKQKNCVFVEYELPICFDCFEEIKEVCESCDQKLAATWLGLNLCMACHDETCL